MTDRDLSRLLQECAEARDASLGAVPVLSARRRAALRAAAGREFAQSDLAAFAFWRPLLAGAALLLVVAGLGLDRWHGADDEPERLAQRASLRRPIAMTPSALLAVVRPIEASLLDEDEIRLELAATSPPRPTAFAISNHDRWPSVSDTRPPGGSGL